MEKYKSFIGKLGEDRAKEYLTQNGYKILECNYFCRFGEIDIIISVIYRWEKII